MPKNDLMKMFGYQVRGAAGWRSQQAKEFPADTRNQKAAEELKRLGAQIEGLSGSSIEEEISYLDARLSEVDRDHKIRTGINGEMSRCLCSIGFYESYETGLSLVEWYRDLLQDKLRT